MPSGCLSLAINCEEELRMTRSGTEIQTVHLFLTFGNLNTIGTDFCWQSKHIIYITNQHPFAPMFF